MGGNPVNPDKPALPKNRPPVKKKTCQEKESIFYAYICTTYIKIPCRQVTVL